MSNEKKQVYAAIKNVQEAMSKEGISKGQKNSSQGYMFRGIDDVYKSLAPLLAKNGLVILPRVIGRECVERKTSNNKIMLYAVLDVEFDFVSVSDGSIHTTRVSGEANDTADKATNKAFTAAYKYLCFQVFCIPVQGQPDADADHNEALPTAPEKKEPTFELVSEWFNKAYNLSNLQEIYEDNINLFKGEEKEKLIAIKEIRKDELINS